MELKRTGITDFCRSPISKAKDGVLNQMDILSIASQVVSQLVKRNPRLPLENIEVVAAGCAFPEAESGFNIGRAIVVKAGLPLGTAGLTINHFCGSSQTAVAVVSDMIACGKADIGIAVGLEHMKRTPMGGFNPFYNKELYEKNFYINMGITAENLAQDLSISREEQDSFSIESHRKALKAWEENSFAKEVVPITLPDGTLFIKDDNPRLPDKEKMATLKPAFDTKGTITAATASPVTNGAAAAIIMSEEFARKLDMPFRAEIVTSAMAGCDYTRMGMGPLPATEKALKRAKITMDEIDIIELNEAFAAQSLYVIKKGKWDINKINILGGAIALGHPLGMSGVRIVGTAITALEKTGGKLGLATMCIGGGQGVSMILRRGLK